jgi:hypothetical protein
LTRKVVGVLCCFKAPLNREKFIEKGGPMVVMEVVVDMFFL